METERVNQSSGASQSGDVTDEAVNSSPVIRTEGEKEGDAVETVAAETKVLQVISWVGEESCGRIEAIETKRAWEWHPIDDLLSA